MNEKDSRKIVSSSNWTLLITFSFFLCFIFLSYNIIKAFGPFSALTSLTITTVLQELVALMLPVLLFFKLKHFKFSEYVRLRPIKAGMSIRILFLAVCGYLFITCFMILWNMIFDMQLSYKPGIEDYISNDFIGMFGMILNISVFSAVAEEILFRGMLLRGLAPLGKILAVALSAFAFSVFHLSFSRLGYTFMLGIIIGAIAIITDNLMYAILYHFLHNTFSIFIDITYLVQTALLSSDRTSYIITYSIIMVVSAFIIFTIFVSIKDRAAAQKQEDLKRKEELEERIALQNAQYELTSRGEESNIETQSESEELFEIKNHELTELLYLKDIFEEKEYLNMPRVKASIKDMLGYIIYIVIATYIITTGILGI